jgi:hypothetical protein
MTATKVVDLFKRMLAFYDEDDVVLWFQSEQKLLDGKCPLNCSDEDVERLVGQLEMGAFI